MLTVARVHARSKPFRSAKTEMNGIAIRRDAESFTLKDGTHVGEEILQEAMDERDNLSPSQKYLTSRTNYSSIDA